MAQPKEGERTGPASELADHRNDRAEDRVHMAEDRTGWAHVRTLLAKERTLSAWLRTGLAVVVAGFAAAQLLRAYDGAFLVAAVSATLVAVGGVILAAGFWSYRQTLEKLEAEGVRGIPVWILATITVVLIVCAAVGVFLIL